MRMTLMLIGIMLILVVTSNPSLAHSPMFSCFYGEDDTIFCEGAFSDGSDAAGTAIKVRDAQGNLLSSGKLDFTGSIELKKPAVDGFEILFDGGPGHQLKVRSIDIRY